MSLNTKPIIKKKIKWNDKWLRGERFTIDWNSWQTVNLVERQEQYSRKNYILIHGVKENQNKDTNEVVMNKIKSEMNLEISRGDIDRIHRISCSKKG